MGVKVLPLQCCLVAPTNFASTTHLDTHCDKIGYGEERQYVSIVSCPRIWHRMTLPGFMNPDCFIQSFKHYPLSHQMSKVVVGVGGGGGGVRALDILILSHR